MLDNTLGVGVGATVRGFSPAGLFASSEPGFWAEVSTSTMWQDTARTTPVTAAGQSVASWALNTASGVVYATQSTLGNRPLYGFEPLGGRRNLLTQTEDIAGAQWVEIGASVTADQATAPDGAATADFFKEDASTGAHQTFLSAGFALTAAAYTYSIYLKPNGRTKAFISLATAGFGFGAGGFFDLNAGSVFSVVNYGGHVGGAATATAVGDGWVRVSIAITGTAATYFPAVLLTDNAYLTSYTGDNTSGVYVWGAQLELGSTPTAYQRVGTALEVTQAGLPTIGYLLFDGSDDFLVTPTITPGTDKVQLFAGVRKLSDAALGFIAELSVEAGLNPGSFNLTGPQSAAPQYGFNSRGSASLQNAIYNNAAVAAPVTNVLSALGDIAGDSAILRVNGVQRASAATDQGTGNYGAYPLYIGRRGNVAGPFNGRIYGMILRFGPNLTAAQLSAAETWVNQRTGAY